MNEELEAQAEAQLAATETVSVPVHPTAEEQRKESLKALGLTEEDLKEAPAPEATEEQKEAFKNVLRWQQTENYKEIVAHYEKEAGSVLKLIQKELADRKEIKLEASELTKLNMYANLVEGLVSKIDRSTEGGKLIGESLDKQVKNSLTHIYGKVEVGFDAPMYTALDIIKETRNFCTTVGFRLDQAVNEFNYEKPQVPKTMHPYED